MVISKQEALRKLLLEIFIILISLIVLIPLYIVVVNSLKSPAEAAAMGISLPDVFHWDNYKVVFITANVALATMNSCILTFGSVAGLLLLASPVAFVMQRRHSKWINFVLIGLIMPGSIVPLYYVMHTLHLTGSLLGVILIYIANGSALSIYLMYEYCKTIPTEIDDSAIVDGCGQLRLFYQIIFPLMRPIIFTVGIFIFIGVWNDFGLVLYFLPSSKNLTLPLTVYYFSGQYRSQWNYIFADIVIITLPVAFIYLIGQKWIISGMTVGAVKG